MKKESYIGHTLGSFSSFFFCLKIFIKLMNKEMQLSKSEVEH